MTEKIFRGFSYYEHNDEFKVVRVIKAPKVSSTDDESIWKVTSPQVTYFDSDSNLVSVESRETMPLRMRVHLNQLIADSRLSTEKSLRELDDLITTGQVSGQNTRQEQVDFHNKIAFFFAPMLVVFLGLRFAYGSHRNIETVKGILFALALGAGYWMVFSAFRAFSLQGGISPMITAWIANIAMMALIIYDFRSTKTF